MIRLARPDIDDEDIEAVAAVLRSGLLVQGEQVARFEAALARTIGVEHAVAVTNGTAALHLALLAAGVGAGRIGRGHRLFVGGDGERDRAGRRHPAVRRHRSRHVQHRS